MHVMTKVIVNQIIVGKIILNNKTLKNKKYYACTSDPECNDVYGVKGNCSNSDPILKQKGITSVGYCVGDGLRLDDNKNCVTVDQIGNNTVDELTICTNGVSGVNGSIQCKEMKDGCAKNGICKNNWQARWVKKSEVNCNKPSSKPSAPKICCDPTSTITPVGGGDPWCCSKPDDGNCKNVTIYGYSANMAGIPGTNYTDTIKCPKGNECDNANDDFIKTLTVTGFTPEQNDTNSAKFAKLYCDKTTDPTNPVCKAQCGFIDNNHKPFPIPSEYAVNDNKDKKVSFCAPDNKCTAPLTYDYIYADPVNDIPICYDTTYKKHDTRMKNLYWSADTTSGKAPYNTQFKVTFNGENCNTPSMCMHRAQGTSGVHNVTESGGNSCIFTADCANVEYTPKGMSSNIKWSEGLTKLDGTKVSPEWKGIAQHTPYKLDPGNKCVGITNDIPIELTTPLQSYTPSEQKCMGNIIIGNKTNLNTTGEYCANGIDPTDNTCN